MNYRVLVTHSKRDKKKARAVLSYQVNNPPFLTVPTHIAIYASEMNSIAQVEDDPG